MVQLLESVDCFVARFERFESDGAKGRHPWLLPVRKAAIARFVELGFPTTNDEEWRFTNLAPIAGTSFEAAGAPVQADQGLVNDAALGIETCTAVLVNGAWAPGQAEEIVLSSGVRMMRLAAAMEREPGLLEAHLGRHAKIQDSAFTALNTALMEDGAVVIVPRGVVAELPVHVISCSQPDQGPMVHHPRILIVAERNSQVDVIETHVGGTGAGYFSNPVTEIVAGESAVVRHYKIVREGRDGFHISNTSIRQDRNSVAHSYTLTLGGRIVRNEIDAYLDGEGADCHIDGLYLSTDDQLVDNHLRVDHLKPRATSREFFKGVLRDRSRGVFSGRIYVARDAQKTDAKQSNMSLLLSDEAQVDSKPQLEIFADDVKCTHGATIGQVDRDAVFYLRSRGLPESAAVGILVHAFALESLEHVPLAALRGRLEGLIEERLPHVELVKETV